MTDPGETVSFRLGYVPGATPGKWARLWAERRPEVALELVMATTEEVLEGIRSGAVDAGVVRLPFDRTGLHAIPLYTETTVAVAPKDHVLAAVDEAGVDDLVEEVVLRLSDDTLAWSGGRPGRDASFGPTTTPEAIELVAAGVGLILVPLSLARLHHRRDLTHRPLTDAPESSVVLAWRDAPDAENTDEMEEFIGIVRGRTVNSSRTPRRREAPVPATPAPSRKGAARRRANRRR